MGCAARATEQRHRRRRVSLQGNAQANIVEVQEYPFANAPTLGSSCFDPSQAMRAYHRNGTIERGAASGSVFFSYPMLLLVSLGLHLVKLLS